MKISYNWLKQYLPINLEAIDTAQFLTDCGLEVEGIEVFQSMKGGLEGIVIGEVKTCSKHPNADKLSITTVDVGGAVPLNIVCGAPNVAEGQKVVVALPGAKLYPSEGDPFEIKKSKIRGEASEGMICAEDEIGMGNSHAGIIVLPADTRIGMPAKEYFNVEEDMVFEIGLTPNRADAASHIGVARDLKAVLENSREPRAKGQEKYQLVYPSTDNFKVDNNDLMIQVEVKDTSACPRYSGVTISGIEVKESPQWLKNKLAAIGVHPINNIVDVTNYVLHECGQPLHAFDADKIKGKKVIVRTAGEGEKFVTLDGIERTLTSTNLMICDENDAMCIGGVFGGMNSGISEKTKNIFIESAYFYPASIRKTSKQHGLKTDASFRFERGTDPESTIYALKRAALLIKEIAGGNISSEIVDIYPENIHPKKVEYNFTSAATLIGKEIQKTELKNILSSLNISVEKESNESLQLVIPTYKVDVTREADVVEEVLRIYGYNNVEVPQKLSAALSFFPKHDADEMQDKISGYLSSNGFLEMMNNTLSKQQYVEMSGENEAVAVKILNPLSQELGVMRHTMLYSGLESIEYNRNRQHADLKFFEFGTTYSNSEKGFNEQQHLSLFVTGKKQDESWNSEKGEVNFFYLKTYVQQILKLSGIDLTKLKEEAASDSFAYGISWKLNEKELVTFGAVSKKNMKPFGISSEVFYADFKWKVLLKSAASNKVRYAEVSKFPQVKRDLSMIINTDVTYGQIRDIAFRTEKNLLKEINLFDVYAGDKIEAGKKSYAVSFILLDEHQTLTDKVIDKVMSRMMEAFEKEAGAVIRK
ncbi:MAG: phenylalanine--tRNA ligase subunit beta [Bacteroidetes bacterium]|nr:phenylalanine--tRNA ligase subunit beta [Bacteroidota bacterium]